MKIGIIGAGVVGRATARAWLEHADDVRLHDRIKARETHDLITTLESDIIFVCVPESVVDGLFSEVSLPPRFRQANFVIKSTVPIGTTRKLRDKYGLPNLVHSPEFLTARCSMTDAQVPARNIVGDPDWESAGLVEEPNFADDLVRLYEKRFPGVPVYRMTSDESEAVKLFCNAFFATKVSFFNEINELSRKLGLDWDTIREGMLSDGRIGAPHTMVPGPDGRRGFGGACLPKDLETLIACFKEHLPQEVLFAKTTYPILSAVWARNNYIDRWKEQV